MGSTLSRGLCVRFGVAILTCFMRGLRLWGLYERTKISAAITVNLPFTVVPFAASASIAYCRSRRCSGRELVAFCGFR